MSIHFSHPQYLLLLPLAWAFTWWTLRDSLADLGGLRKRLAGVVRAILLTLLVLALAGLQLVRPTKTMCTVFVVDLSDSVATAQHDTILKYIHQATRSMRASDHAALVAFGADALLDHAPEDRNAIGKIISLPNKSRTDIAAGIQLAMASFPPESGKQIVIFSDGNENLGNAIDQAGLAHNNDVRISVVPLKRDTSRGEALLLHAEAPREVKQGAPFRVNVLAEAVRETDGAITLYRNNTPVETQRVHLPAGKKIISFEQSVPQSGQYEFKAILEVKAEKDTVPDNNLAYAYTRVAGKPKVLIVENSPADGTFLANALRANDIIVERGGPDRIPKTLAECILYDAVLFANVPAWRMSPTQMSLIQSAVRDLGMGFAMLGGEESFGAGGYRHTPIEEALPVTMDMKKQKVLPSLTLVIVIDISGSMSETEYGVPKIQIAAKAAEAAVDLLQPIDQVCVIGYDTPQAYTYVVKMTRVDDKQRIFRDINKLAPGGGGIYGYSALKEAHKAIQGANTQIKHIIFCADAADDDEPGDSVNFARQMLTNEKITLSVIGFGSPQDKDWPLYQDMARAGGGNAYLAERFSNLPQIFSRDVMMTARSLLVEESFLARPQDNSHPIMRNLPWGNIPPLLGYVATSPKETPSARMLLTSHKDDPVLATWTYGLGRSLAFTSDATSHWGAHWLKWGAYPSFWTQSLRWTLRQGGTANFQTSVTEDHGRANIVVEAVTPQGEFRNMLDMRAHVAHVNTTGEKGPRATQQVITLMQTAPGRYEGSFETLDIGVYTVTVTERDKESVKAMQTAAIVIPYSPEFQAVRPNHTLLAEIARQARGEVSPKADDIFGRLRFGSRTLQHLWPMLLLLMSILFLFDVAVRRILLPWEEIFGLIKQAVIGRLPSWKTATAPAGTPTHSPTLGNLLGTKEKARRPIDTGALPDTSNLRRKFQEQSGPTPPPTSDAATPVSPQQQAPPPPAEPISTAGVLLKKKRERGKM
ncbi:MAG: VWA domain-containing protein [Armatimonadota bacterium]